jgi:hypothetical protein
VLHGSTVLSRVTNATLSRGFLAKLTTEWLPDKRFALIYRGSRDGMTPTAFHDKCDGKGPTLVLVAGQSVGKPVCVFGEYAGKSWERGPPSGANIDARDSFMFTVANSFGDGIVKIPVNSSSTWANLALWCHREWGPTFAGRVCHDLGQCSRAGSTGSFDASSHCNMQPPGTYGDPLGRGVASFTGSANFTP